MKKPKTVKRYCPHCKKHTEHKVFVAPKKTRGTAHPLSRWSNVRVRKRGLRRGVGNLGKFSRTPKPKMTGKKQSKKTDLRYQCLVCKKIHVQSQGIRTKKLELV